MIIGEWIRRLGYLLRRRAHEDELRREMETHRALLEDPRAFGNTLRLRDEAQDAWGWTWFDDFVQDTRFALRTLRHSPGFALTAVVTLAFGIGVNSAMFSFVNGLLLRPLYERPDEVVGVYGRKHGAFRRRSGLGLLLPELPLSPGRHDRHLRERCRLFHSCSSAWTPARARSARWRPPRRQTTSTSSTSHWLLDARSQRKKNGPGPISASRSSVIHSGSALAPTRASSGGRCGSTASRSR